MSSDSFRIQWQTEQFQRQISRELKSRLDQAASELRTDIVKSIGIPTRTSGPSLPGEAPHAEKGRLRQSIFVGAPDEWRRIVGTNLKYGLWLEVGTTSTVTIRAKPGKSLLVPVKDTDVTAKRTKNGKTQIKLQGSDKWRRAVKKGKRFCIFLKSVKRGPMKARPYLRPAFNRMLPRITEILGNPIDLKG